MEVSKDQYKSALAAEGVLRGDNLKLLSFMFFSEECEVTAHQLTKALGFGDQIAPANAAVGNLGKRIASHLSLDVPERENKSPGWWRVVATGEQKADGFTWRLRQNLADALIELDLIIEPTSEVYPELVTEYGPSYEGAVSIVKINAYERNQCARTLCIQHYGTTCQVCGLSFEEKYGEIGRDFIHVHHLTELASVGREYQVNAKQDLRPVCPNCHAMLHRRKPAYSIEELRELMQAQADA
ncbi:HNH endonuclease [Granulosicoccaceae sp. 1_MG-2023]|nr:HNH endonuclease [Granulosicoccaceae sp. 1_MG-2023]